MTTYFLDNGKCEIFFKFEHEIFERKRFVQKNYGLINRIKFYSIR